jgi:hypothetical protein
VKLYDKHWIASYHITSHDVLLYWAISTVVGCQSGDMRSDLLRSVAVLAMECSVSSIRRDASTAVSIATTSVV